MIKIIKPGKNITPIYRRVCNRCGCEYEFEQKDVKEKIFDQREGQEIWFLPCPECGNSSGFVKPRPIKNREK